MLLRYSFVILSIFIGSCKPAKQVSTPTETTNMPAIQLDTVQVVSTPTVKTQVYRQTNTRMADLLHTRLEVDFDWTACRMNGKASLQLKPYFYPQNMLYLNARGMDIKKLEVYEVANNPVQGGNKNTENHSNAGNITKSSYVYENDSIKIDLGKTFTKDQTYLVLIDYVAKPNELSSKGGSQAITEDKGLYFINPTGENLFKMPQIWTQGETQASSVWFPTIDSPNERMTQEILMTVEDRFTTLSNGTLINSQKNADGKRVDHWKLDLPHAPYLAMMAVGEFVKVTDEPWNGKEISYYVERDYEQYAKEIFGDTREMIEFFSAKLGVPYVWPKYAQIVARDYVSGAMENTSATLHGDFMVYQTRREMLDYKKGTSVIAHELFHQWFGDLVTCESWSNLPLNESFATYSEYLWDEYKYGRDAADDHHWQSRQGYIHSEKEADLIRFDYADKEDMFDGISYNKGGQVLHMLRKVVGDEAFFASLKNYLESNKFKSVEIHNLRLAFEETTGQDLNWFFNQWFLNKGRPKLKISVKENAGAFVELSIDQVQDLSKAPLYKLPVEVDIYSNGKAERKKIIITQKAQTFTLAVNGKLELLNFDAERQLLADIEYPKTIEQFVFQYHHAPLYGDRLDALKSLETKLGDTTVFSLFKHAAQNDKYYQIRSFAIARMEKVSPEKADELKTTLLNIYTNDKSTMTRAKALNVLNKRFGVDADIKELNDKALNEASYAICGEAIEMISKHDPQTALQKAKRFEKESGKDVLFPVATLYSNHGSDEQMPFFHNSVKYYNGFEIMSFCALYAKTAKRCNESTSVINAAMDLEVIAKGANKYVKFSAAKGIKDILTVWENKEKSMETKLDAARKDGKPTAELEKQLKEIAETREILTKIYDRTK